MSGIYSKLAEGDIEGLWSHLSAPTVTQVFGALDATMEHGDVHGYLSDLRVEVSLMQGGWVVEAEQGNMR